MPVEGETRVVGNGVGTYRMINDKLVFRITSMVANKGKDNENMKKLRETRNAKPAYPTISPRSARIAFNKFYRSKYYEKKTSRKAAITRDLCSDNKKVVNDTRYKRSPHKYNYPNLDDGSQCPPGHKVYKKRVVSPKYAKGSEEAKLVMEKLRAAKAKKKLERLEELNKDKSE